MACRYTPRKATYHNQRNVKKEVGVFQLRETGGHYTQFTDGSQHAVLVRQLPVKDFEPRFDCLADERRTAELLRGQELVWRHLHIDSLGCVIENDLLSSVLRNWGFGGCFSH